MKNENRCEININFFPLFWMHKREEEKFIWTILFSGQQRNWKTYFGLRVSLSLILPLLKRKIVILVWNNFSVFPYCLTKWETWSLSSFLFYSLHLSQSKRVFKKNLLQEGVVWQIFHLNKDDANTSFLHTRI